MALGKTVGQLLNEISCAELSEWMAYDEIEPFGDRRADYQASLIASTFVNCNLKKGAKRYKPSDFMPQFGPPKKQSPEAIKAVFMGLVSATKSRE